MADERPQAGSIVETAEASTICGRCGASTPASGRFCQACGTNLNPEPRTCPACAAVASPIAKFCANCGAQLEPKADPAGAAAGAGEAATTPAAGGGPAMPATARQDRRIAYGFWFAALFLFLIGTDYISAPAGKGCLIFAAFCGIAGYRIWPKKSS